MRNFIKLSYFRPFWPLLLSLLSPRKMRTLTFCTEDMELLDTVDTMDGHPMLPVRTTESDLLISSPRPILTLTFCMEDMGMDTLDTVDTMDTHMVDMPTTDKL